MYDVRQLSHNDILTKISEFKASEKYEKMLTGERYFKSETDILTRKFYYYPMQVKKNDPYRANNKIVDNFFRLQVEQKVSYCLSKPVVITGYMPTFDVNDFIDMVAEDASIKGKAWVMPYIDSLKTLKFASIPAEQIIPTYDHKAEKTLLYCIRFYDIDKTAYVEVSDSMRTIYYIKKDDKTLEMQNIVNHGWDKVPFIELCNNRWEISDLDNIKALIDSYDKTISDFANNFEDFQDVYYKIKNYSGSTATLEDMAVIIETLKQNKVINVDADGDFEAVQLEIPYMAREAYLKIVRQGIFLFGQGVDTDDLSGGSLTNVAIQSKFANLEQKCNKFIKFLKRFIENCLYFDIKYKTRSNNPEINIKNLEITFNTSLLINETETIDNINTSTGGEKTMSQQTAVAKNPLVDDAEEEIKLINDEDIKYDENIVGEGDELNDFAGSKKDVE